MDSPADVCNATVVHRLDLHDELSIVRIRPDSGVVPEFEAGQFITLGLPRAPEPPPPGVPVRPDRPGRVRLIRRAYSIASSPRERSYIELYVVLVEEGKLTPKLWTVGEGGRVWMDDKIKGEFTLGDAPADKDLVMISTGTGIAPYLSMLRTYRGESRWRRFIIINGARYARDLGYRDELEAICREDPTVRYVPIVSREPADGGWTGLRGHVQAVLAEQTYREHVGAPLDPNECHVFLCGNPKMIEDVQALLHERGFTTHTRQEPGNIHFERYW